MFKLLAKRKYSAARILLVAICFVSSISFLGWGIGRMQGASGIIGNWFGVAGQSASPQSAKGGKGSRRISNYDIRVNGQAELSKLIESDNAGKSAADGRARIQLQVQSHARAMERGLTLLRQSAPNAEVTISPLLSTVEVVRAPGGLTPAYDGQAIDIVRSFLRANKGLYGLTDSDVDTMHSFGESVSQESGLRMVRVEQMINGRPVFQSETRFTMSRDGRLIRSVGLFVPRLGVAPSLGTVIPAQEALTKAMASVGITLGTADMVTTNIKANSAENEIVATHPQINGNIISRLVYFPVAPGVLVPAWSQVTFTRGEQDWYTLVDATTGTLLWRKGIRANASVHDARFRVYVQADGKTPADSPAPMSPTTAVPGAGTQAAAISPTIVSMLGVQNTTASPNGWINDCPAGGCTANETQTIGNNVHAYMDAQAGGNNNLPDTNASFVIDGNGKPTGNPDSNGRNRDFLGTTPRDFQTNYLPPPQAGNPEAGQTATGAGSNGTNALDQFRRGMLTQLFYTTNWYHDRLYALGFDEAAGNFQQTNFSGMGLGGDRVLAEGQDNMDVNNANFSTPPDGQSGRAQMFRFTGPTIDRDGSLDSEVLIHELTHGLSNRLIGNGAGLNWDVGGGMGEGWSDFYALSLLNNTNADDPNGRYATGAYATYKLSGLPYTDNYVYGIRRFPYSTDNTVNPLTWADVDDVTNNLSGGIAPDPVGFNDGGGMEVHNVGEVWALSLWEVRSRVIAANGGDVPTGNSIMLRIVTDALKMTPIDPTFTQARDALIDADCATNACANEQSIWAGFADRGLGYKAAAPLAIVFGYTAGHMGITESFASPNLDTQSVVIDDSLGNNNGSIDPGEPIKLTVTLKNPWRSTAKGVASATATLTTSTAGVTIVDGNSSYGAIPAQGSVAGDTFLFTVPTNATCGQSLKFTIATNSALGAGTINLAFRVGQATGTGAPVTYTKTHSPGLAIPDGPRPRGVISTLSVTDDYEIADLNFRLDSVSHTFTGDLTFMLKGPTGYGAELVSLIGALTDGGSGDNITNMVIDGDIASTAANDMVQVAPTAAPYTKSWLPVFNGPWPSLAGFPGPDAVDQLSRFDNTSTQGNWNVLASDQFAQDTGTLNSWSLIVTPKSYSCAAFTPMVAVSGTKTVSGSFFPNQPITYTVTLTNNGALAQPDNSGNEFTDTLPSQVTLVSASSSSGTATTAGNTVNWNGSLPALGGSVTITINATINANASGTVSNQGTIAYDPTGDGTNDASAQTDDPGTIAANDPTSFTVTCPTITLSALPGSAAAGTVFNQTIVASPAGAYTYTQSGGTLPPGLTLASNGTLSGTPTTAGTYTFAVTANVGICSGQRTYTLVITCPTITFSPATLANGEVGTAYSQTITASPAGGNYTYAVTSGLLPNGLTLNAATGVISGTPSATGTFNFRVTATGFGSCSAFRDYQIIVPGCATFLLTPTKLSDGTVGTAYTQTVTVASPVTGTFVFSVSSGTLPSGLSLDSSTGIISGTPTTAGSFSFRITATLGSCSGFRDYTVTITCPTITLGTLSNPTAGVAYSGSVAASPAGTYTYSVLTGSLPSGLTLNASTGAITGLPSVAGTYTFSIKAAAGSGCSGSQSYSLTVTCPTVTVSPASLPNGTVGTAFSQTISATPATGSYTFAVTSGALPTGLNLNPSTGVLSGTPTTNGTYSFNVTATGFGSCSAAKSYSITIGTGGCPTITLPTITGTGSIGSPYNQSVAASPAGYYTYALTGTTPPGVTFYNAAALLYGYPTTNGTYNFTITATDSSNCTGSKSYSITIGGAFARAVVNDFDGDGKSDLVVWRGKQSQWEIAGSADGKSQFVQWSEAFDANTDVMACGDYDGDGKYDLAFYRRASGQWLIHSSKDNSTRVEQWGIAGDVPVSADYDGDGKADLAVWRESEGAWYIKRSSDGQVQTEQLGSSGLLFRDVPVPADYDGDGKADIAIFRQGIRQAGHWYIKQSSDGQVIEKEWGLSRDVPVVADYDGDGKADIAVWRASDNTWYILRNSDGQANATAWGISKLGDVPVAGDYDGDGKADFAVWRKSEGRGYVLQSSDATTRMVTQGQASDRPVTGTP